MNANIYKFSPGDWMTTIGENQKPLLNQVFQHSPNIVNEFKAPKDDGFESVYFRKTQPKEKAKSKKQKKKSNKQKRVAPHPPTSVLQRLNESSERVSFRPYTTSCFQYNNLYKSHVTPKYLNGTIASDMKKVGKEYWPSRYFSPAPFVTSHTRNTHNLFLLKQETFAKIKAAILPFRSNELNDQSINSLRSIKRSIEKYWKL